MIMTEDNNKLVFHNKTGLRARTAALLAKLTRLFDAVILVRCNGKMVNAAEILDVLSVCDAKGHNITVITSGHDARDVMRAVVDVFAYNHEISKNRRQWC